MSTKTVTQTLAALAALGIVATGLSGCSALEKDAWAITYQLTVPGADSVQLLDVSYVSQDKRGEDPKTVSLSTVTTGPVEGLADATGWQAEGMLEVGLDASLSATAPEGMIATCDILLDGTRSIASNQSEPGGTVTCQAVAPEFDK